MPGTEHDEAFARAIALSLEGSHAPHSGSHDEGGKTTGKAPREGVTAAPTPLLLALQAPGYSTSVVLPSDVRMHILMPEIMVEHGSSLSLIARCTSVLNEEFTNVDLAEDFEKWGKIGARPYFFAVVDPTSGRPYSALRAILDGDFESSVPMSEHIAGFSHRRIVVEYLSTPKPYRGQGHASRLLALVKDLAASHSNCNIFVSSLEESCVYWMNHGFVLENGEINKRLNTFPDTYLLKLVSNLPDTFHEVLSSDEDEEDGNDSSDDGEGSESSDVNSESSDDDSEEEDIEEAQLQRALLNSLVQAQPGVGSEGISTAQGVIASQSSNVIDLTSSDFNAST